MEKPVHAKFEEEFIKGIGLAAQANAMTRIAGANDVSRNVERGELGKIARAVASDETKLEPFLEP